MAELDVKYSQLFSFSDLFELPSIEMSFNYQKILEAMY